jgi:anti-anti-sigma factor
MSAPVEDRALTLEMTEFSDAARVRLRVRGELDLATADVLADRLRRLQDRRAAVLLDLDELAFMDATGLRVVLTAADTARNDGWAFTVTRGSARVRRLFDVLGLDEHLPYEGAP